MKHTQQLEKEIAAARADLQACTNEVERLNAGIKAAIVKGEDERTVDMKQTERDIVLRKLERLTLALQSLESQRPEAAATDAKEKLPHLEKSLQSRAKRIHEAYTGLVGAAEALEKALTHCEATQTECGDVKNIEAEMLSLCETYALDCPTLPAVPRFPDKLTFATPGIREPFLRTLLARAYRLEQWKPVVKQKRELTEEQKEAKRQAEAWLASDPATRGFLLDLHPQAVFFVPKEVYEAERRREVPPGHPRSTKNNWVPESQIARGW